MKKNIIMCFAVLCFLLIPVFSFGATIFFQENFDDANVASRGWYDPDLERGSGTVTTAEHIEGSTASFECRWIAGGSGCVGGVPRRHKFTLSNAVYISFWMKHSTSWTGKGTHVFYLLTTKDGDYSGLAQTHLTAYFNDGTATRYKPDLELQDALNIDLSKIGVDLTQVTENRASHGCNGFLETTHDFTSCYLLNGDQLNMRNWVSPVAFTTTPGPNYMGDWHFVEAYYKLNELDSNNKGMANGILQFWLDGQQLINKTNVIFRTGQNSDMLFNQLILAPYMGTSEAAQAIWIDNLTVADSRPAAPNTFTVTATAGSGGSISPSGAVVVNSGSIPTFTVTPDLGYQIDTVQGCDGLLEGNIYTTGPIVDNCIVFVTFKPIVQPTLLFSTSYDCPEWIQGQTFNCPGFNRGGDWVCQNGDGTTQREQITTAASRIGDGTRGQRHWIGDGLNNDSGSTQLIFNPPQSDVWVRWYMRFQPGFKWSSYEGFKILYFASTSGGSGPLYYMIAYNSDWLAMYPQIGGNQQPSPYLDSLNHYYCDNCGWLTLFPNGASDGAWHEFEIHVKIETPGQSNGIFQAWLDGRLVIDANTVNYGMANTGSKFAYVTVGSNTKYPNNGQCYYADFDDIAVSNTGYIGPIGGQQYTVTATAGDGGSLTPLGDIPVSSGGTQTFTVTPGPGYHIETVTGCGGSLNENIYTTAPITANCSVHASFESNPVTYTITATAGAGGSISPSGNITLNSGSSQTFMIVPEAGYQISDIRVDNESQGAMTYYTFDNVTTNHSINAYFIYTGSPLSWSTTYNCPDWEAPIDFNCGGLYNGLDGGCDNDGVLDENDDKFYEQITAFANNTSGGGFKGQRHWIGDGFVNNTSGGTEFLFPGSPSELWMRWYMRWQPGFKWNNGSLGYGSKVLYLHDTAGVNFMYLMIHNEPHKWDMFTQDGDGKHYLSTGGGWEDLFPTGSSDGSWHAFEIRLKRETTSTSSDGVWEMWVDGIRRASHKNINFGMAGRNATLSKVTVGSNSAAGANGGCAFVDYDDIAVSNTGYIGLIPGAQFIVTPNPGPGGTMIPSNPVPVNTGGGVLFTITSNPGYHISSVSGCAGALNGNSYLTGPIFADCTVSATFVPDSTVQYTVTGVAIGNGTITPSPQVVPSGGTATLTVTPDAGNHIVVVTGCNGNLDGSTYTTGTITADCTVTATFAVNGGTPPALLWSTTYDCVDWNTPSGVLNCDGLVKGGDWSCNEGGTFYEQITAAANNPSGMGGKGQRRWKGGGVNNNSGGTRITFDAAKNEIWIRWYMRYQQGFKWNPLYGDMISTVNNNIHFDFDDWDRVKIYDGAGGINHRSTTGGWDTIMRNGATDALTGHKTSDGQFHLYEVHLKNNGTSGIAEFWIDGIKYVSESNANYGTDFTYFVVGGGANNPNNGVCYAIDYDDIAISSTRYIGAIYSVTATAEAGGSISPSGIIKVNSGSTLEFTVSPAAGYQISSVTGCGGTLDENLYATGPITADCTVTATFTVNQYTVTGIAVGNGTIAPASQTVPSGSTATLTVTPDAGNHIVSVTGCNGNLDGSTYTTGVITADCTVTATFAINGGTPPELLWSTTYECADWNNPSTALVCDGLAKVGDWSCNEGGTFYEQITAAANNPVGSGGKGQRRWKGGGVNNNSGGTKITFDTPQNEIWIRWYMRYQEGFKWNPLYGDMISTVNNNIHFDFDDWDRVKIYDGAGGINHRSTTGGWDTVMRNGSIDPATGHRTSDGQFHLYEVHLKNNGTSGIAEFWIDGIKYVSESNANYGTDFTYFVVGGGANNPNNGVCYAIDYDDIAISNTGYIGPIPGGPYTITTSTGAGCTISFPVPSGLNQTFTIAPDPGYHIVDVKVDGISKGAITSYSLADINANHSITTICATP